MKTLRISLTALMLVAGLAVLGGPVQVAALPAANTIEVSQHTYLTANGEYDRNPSIIHDGTDYWLFWTKADSGGVRGEGDYDPDDDTYVVYYKKASTIPGLAGATETKLALSDPGPPYDFDQRVVTAVVANDGTQDCIYAIVSSGFSASHRSHGMYYYKYDGSTWTGPVTMIAPDSANQYGAHVNAVSDGSTIYIVWDNSKSQFFTFDPGTDTLTGPTQISTDNMPKITLMGSTLYVVSIEDGSGDIEVYSSATSPVSWSPHSTAIAGGGMYDPCIFNDGTNLYVVSAPWVATDRQYLVQTKYSGGSWATPKTVSYGGYGSTEWWDYWPIGYHDGTDAYVFFTTETDSPAFSDGEIATVKMDWDLSHDHYFYIQNAVDQASSGDTVNVAAGTYAEYVHITTDDLIVQGAGVDQSIIDLDGLKPYWHYTGSSSYAGRGGVLISGYGNTDGEAELVENVTFSGFTIKNAGINAPSDPGVNPTWYDEDGDGQDDIRGILIHSGKNIVIQNCKVEYSGDYGIASGRARLGSRKNSEALTVSGCTVSNNHDTGINIADTVGTNGVTITDNTVSNNLNPDNLENHAKGICVSGRSNSAPLGGTISGNTVSGNIYYGIEAYKYTDGVTVENNTVTGHNLHVDAAGIFVSTGWGFGKTCKNHTIRNNIVTGNIRGIVTYYAWDSEISGNTISTDAGTFAHEQAAVKIDHSYNLTVQNNTIGCDGPGIRVLGSDSYGSSFTGNTITGAEIAGIMIDSGAHDNTFTGNTIANTTMGTKYAGQAYEIHEGDGVFLWSDETNAPGSSAGTGNVFHGNAIYGNADDGMENQTATTVDASGNWWGTNTPAGVAAEVSANVDYTPWLDSGTDTSADPGFQGDFSALHVDDDSPQTGTSRRIQEGIDMVSGSTVYVAAGTYTEAATVPPGAELTIQGAGRDVTTWIAPADDASRMHCIQCELQGYTGSTTLDISGFTFSVEDNEIDNGGIAILVNKARQGPLNLAIHDNKFVETTTIPGETANSMLLCHNRFAARGTDAPVKIYNNLDETAGGIAMSNSRAFDVYNNTFDGGSDALYIGYGCPTNTTVGDHHIYNNTFKNASNVYPDGPWPSILFSYYGSGTGMTFLPSTIEHNFFEDNDVAVGYGMDSDITYPADVIRDNSFEGSNEYAVQVWGAYSTTVDASGNWWGTNTPAGVAASVSGDVDYTPWLDSGTDTSADPGFQGDFSALHVDDDSPQTGTAGYVQEGIDMVSGSTVYVAPGTYAERVTINESIDLRGAQYGVDPTAAGARTTPANESIITEAGLSTPNPDVLIEIPNGVTNVKVDGFTLVGDSNNTTADTSTVRAWDDDITVSNNIIDGMYGVLYKGGDTLTVHRNRMVVNKLGVTVQPNPASNVTISENVFNLGSSPVGGESAIYMTGCTQCSATGNTATSFANGNGIGGSNLSHLTVSGNTFTGNKKGVNIWGNSTYILISNNDLGSSVEYGISVKGQDVTITGNEIKDNGDAGVNIDRHVIDTERVEVHYNNITGNTNYGLKVGTADGIEAVNASCNWWGAADGPSGVGPGSGDAVTTKALFDPWLLGPAPDGPCGGSIYVEKYHDQDKDGQDDAEPRLDGWKITLFDDGWQEVASDYTHDGGQVAFPGLSFGNYYVCEEMQDGWVNSDPGNTCQTAIIGSGAATQGPGSTTLTTDGNSYQIDFLGTSDGGLTWNYKVTEVSGKDLSHWVLGLCMDKDAVTGWSPEAGAGIENVELVYPDPTTHLSGIKWDVKDDYNGDGNADGDVLEFSFTLDDVYPVGTTEVGIKTGGKDNKTATGFIAGPHCGDGSSEAMLVFGNHKEKDTAVTLASFTAEPGLGSVVLAWETGTEVDNAGFNLYRATAEGGPYAKVNGALIAAEGDPVSGASYSFLDKGLSPGTYFYKLEDVDLTGTTTLHEPVSAAVLPRLRRPTYRPTLP
jgi:parallel beta-helix repeat protein